MREGGQNWREQERTSFDFLANTVVVLRTGKRPRIKIPSSQYADVEKKKKLDCLARGKKYVNGFNGRWNPSIRRRDRTDAGGCHLAGWAQKGNGSGEGEVQHREYF